MFTRYDIRLILSLVMRDDTRSLGSVVIREDEFAALELLAEMRACS